MISKIMSVPLYEAKDLVTLGRHHLPTRRTRPGKIGRLSSWTETDVALRFFSPFSVFSDTNFE